jgi:elongator complex protein 3
MFEACNGKRGTSLHQAQVINESAKQRVVGISIETRPDWINEAEVKLLRELGVTKIQLGVQALDSKILRKVKRGHSIRPIVKATKLLRNSGFKICFHFMPNLPGSNPKKDVDMAKIMYSDPRFKPDFVKIYPTQVIPNTELYRQWKKNLFNSYNDQKLKQVLTEIKLITPRWVRIDRLVRDISKQWVAGGTMKTNLRQIIADELKSKSINCQCIRCREIKARVYSEEALELKKTYIDTLGGKEIFLEFVKNEFLYSLLRLRLPNRRQKILFPELLNSAIVREIHTFGTVAPLKENNLKKTQHHGLGKSLLIEAEKIAKKEGYKRIAIISAIGTRNYYRKLGYFLEGYYMVKRI